MTTRYWVGSGDMQSTNFFDPNNWNPQGAPSVNDKLFITSESGVSQITLALPDDETLENLLINVTGSASNEGTSTFALIAPGATVLNSDLRVSSIGGTLEVQIEPDDESGEAGIFTIASHTKDHVGNGVVDSSVYVGQGSGIVFKGGTVQIEENDILLVEGKALLDATTTLAGSGTILVQGGGDVDIEGSASVDTTIAFSDKNGFAAGSLTIGNISQFQANIDLGQYGDQIVIEDLRATQAHYAADVLHLLDQSGNELGSLKISLPSNPIHIPTTENFNISMVQGVTTITYEPDPRILQDSLPVAVIGEPGSTISFADILQQSFGSSTPAGFDTFALTNLFTGKDALPNLTGSQTETAFWGTGSAAVDSRWVRNVNGKPVEIGNYVQIDSDQINDYSLIIGNSMPNTASFGVLAAGSPEEPLLYRNYNVWTTQPDVVVANFGSGNISPSDIVAATTRFAEVYPEIPNDNDCNWIADNVAASAGAVLPFDNYSDVPAQNVEGGFWRIEYRGDDPADNPVQDWSGLVLPGDVVRMVWAESGGHHTTTVTAGLDGKYITVYDNDDFGEPNGPTHYIDSHQANYWERTTIEGTTIYRLDPNHQYLINGTELSETLQGSVYNNLIRPNGGADVITGGQGDNEVQGTTAELNGITVTDWHDGDWLDATDLTPGTASVSYNASLGFLTIQGLSNGTGGAATGTALSATVTLSAGLQDTFFVSSDPFGSGVEVRSLPVSDSISFDFALTDATVTFVGGHKLVTGTDGLARDVTGIGTLAFTDGTVVEKDGFALVDDLFYFARNLDVWAAHNDGRGVDADAHYLNGGWREGRDPNAFFSTDGYRAANPDVAAVGVDPLIHYHNGGWNEGRTSAGRGQTEDHFSADAYRAAYADVREAGIDPLAHFLAADASEGRLSIIG